MFTYWYPEKCKKFTIPVPFLSPATTKKYAIIATMSELQPGQTIGAYRIINQIGQGGMATVYKAYHAAMDRYVALKVLPRQFMESKEFIGRFQQEARLIANLEHPHILPVHDFGEYQGTLYFVMRFLDAGTLKERIQKGLTLHEVDELFTQLAEALGYAHEKGIIHRDIKPSNVLVDARGNLFLTDFGIAKLLESSSHLTATGALTGTPAYMSPEQAQGKKVDLRTDIYSLGIVLYEMVTGRVPFEAETPWAVVLKQIQEPLPLPSQVKPDIPFSIERVILKALAKEPEDRFATTAEFLAAWKQAFQEVQRGIITLHPPEQKPPPLPPTLPGAITPPTVPTTTRKLPVAWIVGGAVLLLIVVAALVLPQLRPADGDTPTPIPNTETEPETAVSLNLPSGWTSWTNGNLIFSVAVHEEEIYTGGPGGVTVWSRADGTAIRRYTTAEGLPDPRVNTIFIDTDGSLWVGTTSGVAHLNGTEWVIYDQEDGLDSEVVQAIERVGDYLVVGTFYSGIPGGGLNLYDGRSWTPMPNFPSAIPEEQPEQLANFVNVILPGENGRFAVGTTNGLGLYDGSTWTRYSTADGLPSNNILTLAVGDNNSLIIGTDTMVATLQQDGRVETAPQGPEYGVNGIVKDENGRYWLSGGGGIWEYDPANGNWERHSQDNGELSSYSILRAVRDAQGFLYFGSDNGLIRYANDQFTTWQLPNVPFASSFDYIFALPNGNLQFVEESGTGTSQLNPTTQTWSRFEPPCSCFLFTVDPQGNIWGNEWMNGVWVVAPDGTTTNYNQGFPPESHVWSIAFTTDGTPWVGTDKGLTRMEEGQVVETFTTENTPLNDNWVRLLRATSDGSLWVATDRGLSRRSPDGEWQLFTIGNPFLDDVPYVTDIAEGTNGEVWVTVAGQGVFRWENGNWQNFYPNTGNVQLPSSNVRSVAVEQNGRIWFGTDSGVAIYDGTTWQTLRTTDGLIDNLVNDIYIHPSGTVWFATRGGISQYIP